MAGVAYVAGPWGARSAWRLVTSVLVSTFVAGALLGLVGGWWGRTPAGNTALVVPFAGGSALAAAAWIALTLGVRHTQASRGRLVLGAGLGGLAALVASLAAIFMPLLSASSSAPPPPPPGVATAMIAVWHVAAAVAGTVLAYLLGYPLGRTARVAVGLGTVCSIALVVLPTGLGWLLEPFVLPLLVAVPLLVGRTVGRRAGGLVSTCVLWIAALAVIVVGIQVGNSLVGLAPAG